MGVAAAVRPPPARVRPERVEPPHVPPAVPLDLVRHSVQLPVRVVRELPVRNAVLVASVGHLDAIYPTLDVSHFTATHIYLQPVFLVGVVATVVPPIGEPGGAGRACHDGSVVASGFHPVRAKHRQIAGADENALVEIGRSGHIRPWSGRAHPPPRPRVDWRVGHYGHAGGAVDHCGLNLRKRVVEHANVRAQPAFAVVGAPAVSVAIAAVVGLEIGMQGVAARGVTPVG